MMQFINKLLILMVKCPPFRGKKFTLTFHDAQITPINDISAKNLFFFLVRYLLPCVTTITETRTLS